MMCVPTSLLALCLADQAFQRILDNRATGWPSHPGFPGVPLQRVEPGMTLDKIEWTQVEGGAMWEGACVVLRMLGVNTGEPLSSPHGGHNP